MAQARIIAAIATRKGTRKYNCDAARIHQLPGTGTVAAVIVDGIGNTPKKAAFSRLAAECIARVSARRDPLLGILHGAALNTAPPGTLIPDDGVAAVAVAAPNRRTAIAWTGDALISGWTGEKLVRRSTLQTMGTWLRAWGGTAVTLHPSEGPDETVSVDRGALVLDDLARSTLGRCSIDTVPLCFVEDPVLILTSDGAHGQIPHQLMEDLAREHADTPRALADAIVAAAEPDKTGYRDDATAIVMKTRT
ncbi:hypothetical protein ABZ714_26475 [Streptomyces sp. NPDC006798]|uniref:hypothetical protein n=1 Tax=Streptomyces sp. NPDC006798 TaxID=3155462 RepID=UPI00340AD908